VDPEEIARLEVLLTMVDGRVVYRLGEFARPPHGTPPTIGPAGPRPPTIGPPRTPADKR